MLNQSEFDYIKRILERGEITVDEANIQKVEMQRVMVVKGRLPASLRKVLNEAVKVGRLAHLKKDGHKPEVYYNPRFKHLATSARKEHENHALQALGKMFIVGV